MQLKELNSGIIFTNSLCIGCNKCISGCIAVGANVVVKDPSSERYTVSVDPNKCILCGTCIKTCVHRARTYRDDTNEFFEALERGERISILVAPTLLTDYEYQYHNILGYLKRLGVNHIYNTAFGGDLMVWVYMNFIHSFGLAGVISQVCPVIVNYLEKYKPQLLGYLMPVQSPMMCTAIYVKDYLKVEDKLAYISPCIAGRYEIDDVNTYGRVTYNVTFERLMQRIEGIDLAGYHAEDEVGYGLGALISMSDGLSDNIERYIGFNEVLIQTAGPTNIFPYFDHYYKEVTQNGQLPFLVDALSCTDGCNFGTGTSCGVELRNQMTFSAHRVKERAYRSGNVSTAQKYDERLSMLNKRFEGFELSSFVRQYDATRQVSSPTLTEEEIDVIFQTMYKITPEHRHTDCGACGYKTCLDMAYAVGMNVNHKENCINYAKECIRLETEKTKRLLDEISSMNDELKKATKLKSNFLANMSHEIRTPMNAIIGMAEMALRGDLPGEERGYIQQIKASGRSLLAIINDILDFSKIESGKMEINETQYKVMSIINDTVNIVMTRIGEKNITLVVDADPDIPFTLYGDDIRIKQVLVNFANNAVKFTESGCVEIRLEHERSEEGVYLTVAIRDTGIGIKEEDLGKLFTSFQQVDSKRNRNVEGTGLGLAISREFVRLMSGKIDVKSTYGEGSTFSFRIPQKIVDDVPSVTIKVARPVRTASFISNAYVKEGFLKAVQRLEIENTECNSLEELESASQGGLSTIFIDYPYWNAQMDALAKRASQVQTVVIVDPRKEVVSASHVRKLHQPVYAINIAAMINNEDVEFDHSKEAKEFRYEAPDANILIVDDNEINLTVAKGLLSPLNMKITAASGAREAISLLEQHKYDIVFMDHMMPDIDGIEATHMIRAMGEPYYENLPIIALTANAINNAKEMFLAEGMNDFVAKPIEMVDITSKLRKWLPPEKIVSLGEKGSAKAPKEKSAALEIEGLDVKAALVLSGTEELYRTVLQDYHASIVKKADLIERYEAEENIEGYTIEVHALKSASRLIGATALSEKAAYLEKCGHDKALGPIHEETAELLRAYRAYLPILAPYGKQESKEPKQEAELTKLVAQLTSLCDALEDFDIDTAKAATEALKAFRFDGEDAAAFQKLCDAVDAVEYFDAEQAANDWKEQLLPRI